jgi:hypothetical protein
MKSRRLCEFRVWQLLSLHQLQECIPKQVLIVSIIKAMFQFVQIGVQMSRRELVVRPYDCALKQNSN